MGKIGTGGVVALSLLSSPVTAETLVEAMARTYRMNPSLHAERYKVRAIDEEVPKALSGWRPRVNAQGFYGARSESSLGGSNGALSNETYGYGLSVEQPLFDGFKTKYAVLQAESGVEAAREDLRAFENELLFQVASAYIDVLRDEGIVLYRRKTLTALKREVIGVGEQLKRGLLTKTDLDQAELRASRAQSDLDEARANLSISQLRYTRLTGNPPTALVMPRFPANFIPPTLSAAAARADNESPIIQASALKQVAASHAVSKARGELLPTATLVGAYDRSVNETSFRPDNDGFSIVGRVKVPLYQAGETSARIRQSHSTALQVEREGQDARARIGEAVRAAWATLASTRARLGADEKAVAAGERALDGVRTEQAHGQRSLIAVLDAERELVEANIRLLRTTRDHNVSAYAMLRTMGKLTMGNMAPGEERYDPAAHYRGVRNKWWGTTPASSGDQEFLGHDAAAKLQQGPDRWRTSLRAGGLKTTDYVGRETTAKRKSDD